MLHQVFFVDFPMEFVTEEDAVSSQSPSLVPKGSSFIFTAGRGGLLLRQVQKQ